MTSYKHNFLDMKVYMNSGREGFMLAEGNSIFANAEYKYVQISQWSDTFAYNQEPHNRNMYLYFASISYDILK